MLQALSRLCIAILEEHTTPVHIMVDRPRRRTSGRVKGGGREPRRGIVVEAVVGKHVSQVNVGVRQMLEENLKVFFLVLSEPSDGDIGAGDCELSLTRRQGSGISHLAGIQLPEILQGDEAPIGCEDGRSASVEGIGADARGTTPWSKP